MLYATIIGINHYRDPHIPDLQYATSDAQRLAELLTSWIRADECQVNLLCDEDATLRNIRRAIGTDLARLSSNEDLCLIYFAGHGSPETDGGIEDTSAYLVAHDTEYRDIFATGFDMERDLAKSFERASRPAIVLGFLDCCFSGRADGRTFKGPRLSALPSRGDLQLSLQDLELGVGRALLTACGPNQVALETHELKGGVFTHYVLESLTRPRESDEFGHPRTIDVALLYAEVAHLTYRYTRGRQTPTLTGQLAGASLPVFSESALPKNGA